MNKKKISEKVIIGSLKGSTHSLGKDIVVATLSATGFQVVDLGVDVSPERFVEAIVREKAKIIGISLSVDRTVPLLRVVVESLKRKKLRDEVGIVVGGQAVSNQTCKEYEVDAYARDARDCVVKVKHLVNLLEDRNLTAYHNSI
ncbi:MAG: cobalamin-dependent protein [Candidatus Bathyarchaeota archaeon]|nr:MAG: cobalamin-dependent protein [Candidatus Bathyarchaeota archaeon]